MKPNFQFFQSQGIQSLKTLKLNKLISVEQFRPTESQLESIVEACATGPVYDWLFKDIFPQGYTQKESVSYVERAKRGWEEMNYFVFFVLDECGLVRGALDIKTADLEAGEIGYWIHPDHGGLATPLVKSITEIAKVAGYKKLFAQIKTGNIRSEKVLLANSFREDPDFLKNTRCQRAFVLNL